MGPVVTFFYSPFCRHCPVALERVTKILLDAGLSFIARMPFASERAKLTGIPALYIPANTLNRPEPYLLVGGQLPDLLQTLLDNANASTGSRS